MATAKVVFATITGNNEDIADIIAQALEEKGMDVEVEEISQADPADFEEVGNRIGDIGAAIQKYVEKENGNA